jgi:ABC-type transporter Mla MlaB component
VKIVHLQFNDVPVGIGAVHRDSQALIEVDYRRNPQCSQPRKVPEQLVKLGKLKSHVMDACMAVLVDVVRHARKSEQREAMASGVVGQKSAHGINVLGL